MSDQGTRAFYAVRRLGGTRGFYPARRRHKPSRHNKMLGGGKDTGRSRAKRSKDLRTQSAPAGRGRGDIKTVAGAAGDAEAGEGEASAAAKAAAALCCAGAEAHVRSPGAERRVLGHCWRRGLRGRGRLAGEGAGGGEAGEAQKNRQMPPKKSADAGGEVAVQAHRSSSVEAWALSGR